MPTWRASMSGIEGGCVWAPVQALDACAGEPAAWMIYTRMTVHARERDRVFAGYDSLARETGLPKTTVRRALRHLALAGLVEVEERGERGRGRATRYRLLPPKRATAVLLKKGHGEEEKDHDGPFPREKRVTGGPFPGEKRATQDTEVDTAVDTTHTHLWRERAEQHAPGDQDQPEPLVTEEDLAPHEENSLLGEREAYPMRTARYLLGDLDQVVDEVLGTINAPRTPRMRTMVRDRLVEGDGEVRPVDLVWTARYAASQESLRAGKDPVYVLGEGFERLLPGGRDWGLRQDVRAIRKARREEAYEEPASLFTWVLSKDEANARDTQYLLAIDEAEQRSSEALQRAMAEEREEHAR